MICCAGAAGRWPSSCPAAATTGPSRWACSEPSWSTSIAARHRARMLDRRAERRGLRPGPDAVGHRPPRGAVAGARRRRGSSRPGWLPNALALARRGEAIHSNDRLRGLVEGLLRVRALRGAAASRSSAWPPTCSRPGRCGSRSGRLVDPILASAALPGILPAVEIDGVRYLDGAIVNDVPDLAGRRPRGHARSTSSTAARSTVPVRSPSGRSTSWCRRTGSRATTASSATSRRLPRGVEAIVLPTGDTPTLRYNDFTHERRAGPRRLRRLRAASSTATSTTRPRCPPGERPTDAASHEA